MTNATKTTADKIIDAARAVVDCVDRMMVVEYQLHARTAELRAAIAAHDEACKNAGGNP